MAQSVFDPIWILKRIRGVVRTAARRAMPAQLEHYVRYRGVARTHGKADSEVHRLFAAMVARSEGKPSLQIGARGSKYAPHWVSIDLYDDSPIIDFQYDVHEMPFASESFDFVVCNAVLEHVENPARAIAELHRVLRPKGEIWVEVPMSQPYHPSPGDFWRVTHKGILIWMKDFVEVSSGLVPIQGSPIYDYVYFHGTKR